MIYVDLDDFSDEYAPQLEAVMPRILAAYPGFKATLFTIPMRTHTGIIEQWNRAYPGVFQFAVHGWTHDQGETWNIDYETAMSWILSKFGKATPKGPEKLHGYVNGFKAPWWKLSYEAACAFDDAGYWVAINKNSPKEIVQGGVWAYDYQTANQEIITDIYYRDTLEQEGQPSQSFHAWHGHVPTQRPYNAVAPNGIGDVLDTFLGEFSKDAAFGFIDDWITNVYRNAPSSGRILGGI